MSNRHDADAPAPCPDVAALPACPSLEHLRKQAKQRLADQRKQRPDTKLADVQRDLARSYGFPSWRALKAHVDALNAAAIDTPPVDDADNIDAQFVEATQRGDVTALARLLDAHPDRMTQARGGTWNQPLLHLAAQANHAACVALLLERGFDPNTTDDLDNAYALHFAAGQGHLQVVQQLIQAGANIHGTGDDHELGILGWATCFDTVHHDVADLLMRHGATPHIFTAIALDRADLVRQLVADDPTQLRRRMSRNEHERHPLHHAVKCNRPAMVKLLLQLGADPTTPDRSGATPIAYAHPDADHNGIFDALTNAGGVPDLLAALTMQRFDLAEQLLADDPQRLAETGRDANALHLAAQRNALDALRWLIEHGADVNAKRVLYGVNMTALHLCAEQGHVDAAKVLLDAGADRTIQDDTYHADARGWAEHCNQPDIAALLV